MQRHDVPASVGALDLRKIVEAFAAVEGGLLPALHAVQAAFGHVPEAAVLALTAAFNLSRAEVEGVISFYHDFRRAAPARPIVRLCRAEACQARGVEKLIAIAGEHPGIEIEPVYCLGLCASGPAALVGDRAFGRLDAARFAQLLEAVS